MPSDKDAPMREDKWGAHPRTLEELTAYIAAQTEKGHDYNTSAEALHDIAVAAFNYAGHALGNSGFQAGYAALKFLGTVNGYDGPYGVIKAETELFPQYESPEEKAREFSKGWQDWVTEQAQAKLKDNPEILHREHFDEKTGETLRFPTVSPTVHAHWQALAARPTSSRERA